MIGALFIPIVFFNTRQKKITDQNITKNQMSTKQPKMPHIDEHVPLAPGENQP